MSNPETITVKEAANKTGIPISRIRGAIRDGRLKAEKIGRAYQIDRASFEEAIIPGLEVVRIGETRRTVKTFDSPGNLYAGKTNVVSFDTIGAADQYEQMILAA